MNIKIIRDKMTKLELEELAKEFYVEMIKGVVDIKKEIIALGGEWHMDANLVLIEDGSKQENLWGFNVYLNKPKGKMVEYNSLINIRPKQGNMSKYVLWKLYPELWIKTKYWEEESRKINGEPIFAKLMSEYEKDFEQGIIPDKRPLYGCWNGCESVKTAFKNYGQLTLEDKDLWNCD